MKPYFSVKRRQGDRAAHRRAGALLDLGVDPTWLTYVSRYGAAEPVLETRRADARVIAGGEALIVHLYAEVACVGVCGHLPCVSVALKNRRTSSSRRYPFGTRHLDRAVQRLLRRRRRPVRQRRHPTRWAA